MAEIWSNLYIPTTDAEAIIAALNAAHQAAGYQPYNPFPGGTGTPSGAKTFIRLFVAPSEGGYVRVIGQPDSATLRDFAQQIEPPVLHIWMDSDALHVIALDADKLTLFLRAGKSALDVKNVIDRIRLAAPESDAPLQGDLADFAAQKGVDVAQAGSLIDKTVGKLFKKMEKRGGDSGAQQNAMQLVSQQALNPARQLQPLTEVLSLPDNWANPSFTDLAAAYPIACTLDQDEDAPLLPGDEDLLDQVDFPLDYTPVYFAK